MEIENENKLNFLDVTITSDQNKFNCNIYRKLSTTDVTINAQSNQPHTQ